MTINEMLAMNTNKINEALALFSTLDDITGKYAWRKFTGNGGTFITCVVADDESAYPNGGSQDGYWYESAGMVVDGILYNKPLRFTTTSKDISLTNLSSVFKGKGCVIYNNEIHLLWNNDHYKWNGKTWSKVSTLPYTFSKYGGVVVYGGAIHILGGGSTSAGQKYHYKWDGSTWTSVSTLPAMFYQHGYAVVYGGKIHIIGGSYGDDIHYAWDGSSWTRASYTPHNYLTNICGTVYNNEIHIFGGHSSGTPSYTKRHYKWDGKTWTRLDDVPYDSPACGCAITCNRGIHVFGGIMSTDSDMVVRYHYEWDGTSWTQLDNVSDFDYNGAIMYNNEIHTFTNLSHYIVGRRTITINIANICGELIIS